MGNNEQIDKTDYYRLPCGRYLEDFIDAQGLGFALGSALKYRYRAGRKDNETKDKDMAKAGHYCQFLAANRRDTTREYWRGYVDRLASEALRWDGGDGED